MRSAVRNTCFAILSSIETDLREILGELALNEGSIDILSPDARENAKGRFEQDNAHRPGAIAENDIDLLAYTDFGDLAKMVRLRSEQITAVCSPGASKLADALESMAAARNRVCHSRPLHSDDLSKFIDLATLLVTEFSNLPWRELKNVNQKIESDPTFVLRLSIPEFWTAAAETIPHNLPMPDFDETGFIGRASESKEILRHVGGYHPLITILGEGGVGKSALALNCLYEILDTKEARFDAIVWVSLKSKILTAAGATDLRDAVTDTLGIVREASAALGGSTELQSFESLLQELRGFMQQLKILLVIDNLETIPLDKARPLFESIPTGSKILITSRIGIGELELRFKLDPLDKKQSAALMRRFARSLNLVLVAEASEERIAKYCQSLYFNPLLIKWFVSTVNAGADPDRLLSKASASFGAALQYCFENLFTRLSESEQNILRVLAAARRQLSQAEIYFLLQEVTSLSQVELETALNVLHNSSMLKRTFRDRRRADAGTQFALTDVSAEYLARFGVQNAKLLQRVQNALKRLREITERSAVQEATYKFNIFAVRAETSDERIAGLHLNAALENSRSGKIPDARKLIEQAKGLTPQFSEVYRISAIVESRGHDLYKADEEIRTAIDLKADSALNHYQFALFLMNEMEDSSAALVQIDEALKLEQGEVTLETARALALTRLGRYPEAAAIYERILKNIADKPRKWRITTTDQAAECYRRWAEKDTTQRDPAARSTHQNRAIEILESALSSNDFDARMGTLYVNVIEDALFDAIRSHERAQAMMLFGRLRDASFLFECPRFRLINFTHFATEFSEDSDFLAELKNLTDKKLVKWAALDLNVPESETLVIEEGEGVGILKALVSGRDFGFITDDQGNDWFFHRLFLLNQADWLSVQQGARVAFAKGRNHKGPCAVRVRIVQK
jgi:LuxR family transcriptional regulator, glucitol operon activator